MKKETVCFRQSQGQEDNFGVYTEYPEEKNSCCGKIFCHFSRRKRRPVYACNLVRWHIFLLCICCAGMEKKPSFWGLLRKLKKKIFEKFKKKLLTLLPGYTIIYLASRMRHKQHGRNNIAFGGVAQLG